MSKSSNSTFYVEQPHAQAIDVILQKLKSRPNGLSREEAASRLKIIGPNRLPNPSKERLLKRFFKHFHDLLIYILIIAAIVTALLGHWIDTSVILGVVIINAIIGFIQEGKAEEALASIRKMLSIHAHVRRDDEWVEIVAEELIPGDIVRLRSGDRVPADMRLIEAVNLRIEESALTGESMPSEKNIEPVSQDASLGDRYDMAYSGTMVTSGRGIGIVTTTAAGTELGRINKLIAEVQTLATPLTRQMNFFGKILSAIILGQAILMFFIGYTFHDFTLDELFLAAIGFAVAAIPEGLPAILTITLALGVQRMVQHNAITRKLNAVETLGSVTVVCSDKTGTLTRNEMTARHIVTRAACYDITGTGYMPQGEITLDGNGVSLDTHPDLHRLIEVMAVCNDSRIGKDADEWIVTGEPTEGALRALAHKACFDDQSYERIALIPFESGSKFMATLDRLPNGARRILLKGAPDRLLERCQFQQSASGLQETLDRVFWEEQIEALGQQGLRVLAAASRDVDYNQHTLTQDDLTEGLIFLGLVGIIDPPRPEAIKAIQACHQAGIRVKMITGDHAGTAKAIGLEMAIGDGKHAVTGAELEAASDQEIRRIVHTNDIFARTSPEHKLRLVQALQANGEIVAMTGDGVNDAPALKRADVGVAMGIKGTEATKEAADIVLADDNFASIERAIEEGRTIYDNLRKAILFTLPTNGAQALVILIAIVFGLVLPLTPVQILWVNMVVAVTLALALAFEPSEPDVMSRPPRAPNAPILGMAFLWRIGFVSVLIGGATVTVFLIEIELGTPVEFARTMAVNTLVCGQAFYLLNSRYLLESSLPLSRLFANPIAWLAIGILAALQLLFVYAPFMHQWFGSTSLELRYWLISVGIGLGIFLLVEIEKMISSKFLNKNQ